MKGWCWFLLRMGYKEANVYSLIYTFYEGRSLWGKKIEYSNKDADACRFGSTGFSCWQQKFSFFKKNVRSWKSQYSVSDVDQIYVQYYHCVCYEEWIGACLKPTKMLTASCCPCWMAATCVQRSWFTNGLCTQSLHYLECFGLQLLDSRGDSPHSHQVKQWTVECEC